MFTLHHLENALFGCSEQWGEHPMTLDILKSRDPLPTIYVIPKRSKIGTFTKSKTKAKAIALASTPPNTQSGSGNMSQPHPASVRAINKSATDDTTSQRPGRGDDQIRPRARTAYMVD